MKQSLFASTSILIAIVCWLSSPLNGQQTNPDDSIGGQVDHVVATLTSKRYLAIAKYLESEFPDCWKSQSNTKGFILCRSQNAYAEIWNSAVWYQYGYQVAFSCPDSLDAPDRASRRFKTTGVHWTDDLFTLGSEGPVGHPDAGTFLVHPGGNQLSDSKEGKIVEFIELVTAIPECRLSEKDNYAWFGMTVSEKDGRPIDAKDHLGFNIRFISIADKSVNQRGHVAMGFRLSKPVETRREVAIEGAGGIKAVFESDRFWLVLQPNLFSETKEPEQ